MARDARAAAASGCAVGSVQGRGAAATVARMTSSRVLAPEPPADGSKPKGPASYFASIEKTYGRPIQEWLDLVNERLDSEPHMQVVSRLKSEHGLGHGHANALVAYVKAARA